MPRLIENRHPVPVQALARTRVRRVHDRTGRDARSSASATATRSSSRRSSGIRPPARSSHPTSSRSARRARSRTGPGCRARPSSTRSTRRSPSRIIQLDGADNSMIHAVDAGSIDAMSTGMRVAPRWRAERIGKINDIECFVPGEEPDVPDDDAGDAPEEPVTMMDYYASITYRNPVPRQRRAGRRRPPRSSACSGQQCPVCGRIYAGGRGYCPIDSVELTEEHDVDLPQRGVVSNYTIVTPVQYPGQTETEPFARVMVLARRRRRRPGLPGAHRRAGRRRPPRHPGRGDVGVARRRTTSTPAACAARSATSSAGSPRASPTTTTPTS